MSLQQSGDQLGETGIIDKIKSTLDNNRENLLIVAFVLIIIGGVWAYMQAPQKPDSSSGIAGEAATSEEEAKNDEQKTEENANEDKTIEVAQADSSANNAENKEAAKTEETALKTETKPEPAATATNDGESVTVTAVKGDGLTHAARKALKEYLSSGNRENLNNEQKIYIEDYLRKYSANKTITPGETLSYKNEMIATAIEKANALTEAQIKNLEKYSKLVKNL